MGYQDLATAIVRQAVKDYKDCIKKGKSVAGLTKFFKSKWCAKLLSETPINGEMILDRLKQETKEYRK